MRRHGISVGIALAVMGCARDRSAAEASPERKPSATVTAPADALPIATPMSRDCRVPVAPLRRLAPKRLVAIGDLHGDLAATRAVLRTAGAIDAHDRWIGGDLVVVQTGDILDRGDDEQAIIDLLETLEVEATKAGGALIWLLGNHELMNAAGDFRYVTPRGMADFVDAKSVDPIRAPQGITEPAARARAAALFPGGAYALIEAGQGVVAIVGDTVFSHAGVLPAWAGRLDEVNRSAACWLASRGAAPPVLDADDGPVWTRAYGIDPPDCVALTTALAALGAERMVVGHTVQEGGITSACNGRLWRIDVGLSRRYGGPIQALSIIYKGRGHAGAKAPAGTSKDPAGLDAAQVTVLKGTR